MCALPVTHHTTEKQPVTPPSAGSLNPGENPEIASSLMNETRQIQRKKTQELNKHNKFKLICCQICK